jgi:nucleotide-binding universal stress UspA family protein
MTTSKKTAGALAPKRILVPCDFSRCSGTALDYAVMLTQPFHATLTLLHVVEPVQTGFLVEAFVPRQFQGQARERALRELTTWASQLPDTVRVGRPLVKAGRSWEIIVAVAQKTHADLIVMGTHGRSGLSHAVLGSVAERVIRHAPCPVLTVPAPSGAKT